MTNFRIIIYTHTHTHTHTHKHKHIHINTHNCLYVQRCRVRLSKMPWWIQKPTFATSPGPLSFHALTPYRCVAVCCSVLQRVAMSPISPQKSQRHLYLQNSPYLRKKNPAHPTKSPTSLQKSPTSSLSRAHIFLPKSPVFPQTSPTPPQKRPISPEKSLTSPQKRPKSAQKRPTSLQTTLYSCATVPYIYLQNWNLHISAKDPKISAQKSPAYLRKRALDLRKLLCTGVQKSPEYIHKRVIFICERALFPQKSPRSPQKSTLYV